VRGAWQPRRPWGLPGGEGSAGGSRPPRAWARRSRLRRPPASPAAGDGWGRGPAPRRTPGPAQPPARRAVTSPRVLAQVACLVLASPSGLAPRLLWRRAGARLAITSGGPPGARARPPRWGGVARGDAALGRPPASPPARAQPSPPPRSGPGTGGARALRPTATSARRGSAFAGIRLPISPRWRRMYSSEVCHPRKKDPAHALDLTREDAEQVQRVSRDGQATVNMGAFARGGHTRGEHTASEHALGGKEKSMPGGSVDEDTAPR
jgi:hypothetical protein